MTDRIHLSKADITEVEEEFVLAALRSGWVAPLGPDVDAFEREVAERVGVRHALALASGTAALHLALLDLGARPGTAVVLPSMTFAASANAVAYTGAETVFVDCQVEDGNVDPDLLIEAVDTLRAEGTQVVAAMTVDLFGRACDYDQIESDLGARGVPLLEDAAESLGATYRGRPAGSFGAAAALSFNGNKIMTTSGGGMLLSDDSRLIEHARKLSTQAREPVPWYEHTEVGYNYRMSNILAALGRGQLTRLDRMIQRRHSIRRRYVEALADLPLRFLGVRPERGDESDNCWLTTAVIESNRIDVNDVLADLEGRGIEARHLWKPMHLQPVYTSDRFFGSTHGESLFRRGLTLPSGSALTDDDIDTVIAALRDALISLR
ncbi:DegT/DnrJ/EryC1/StrS family aminotransferase [Serinicoccus kebangsaanensis]|uniref:DegT/DnrJ/EryC1/StrS family aminotransferase n=1 Tax=Serinicoccus kebangsaanensis TaxID=2602069 RepID=UPI00124C790D|nr:DegT/DnrJ/EryC1/StrS aminotransferase family protein [Serinicoccus kebangsaanensis]